MDLLLQRTASRACSSRYSMWRTWTAGSTSPHCSCINISEQCTQRDDMSSLQHGGCAWCASSPSLCRCSLPRSHCTVEPGSCRDSSHKLPSLLTWGMSHWWGPQAVYHQWGLEWLAVLSRSAPRLTVTLC